MKSLILVGMKHSGKTTLGRLWAQREKLPFHDLDELLTLEHDPPGSLSPREIFKTLGAAVFQRYETQAAVKIARQFEAQPVVLALGGGTVENESAIKALSPQGLFVYLKEAPEVLFQRIMKGGLPAFLPADKPFEAFLKLYAARTVLMEALCPLHVDLHGLNIPQALDRFIQVLKEFSYAR